MVSMNRSRSARGSAPVVIPALVLAAATVVSWQAGSSAVGRPKGHSESGGTATEFGARLCEVVGQPREKLIEVFGMPLVERAAGPESRELVYALRGFRSLVTFKIHNSPTASKVGAMLEGSAPGSLTEAQVFERLGLDASKWDCADVQITNASGGRPEVVMYEERHCKNNGIQVRVRYSDTKTRTYFEVARTRFGN